MEMQIIMDARIPASMSMVMELAEDMAQELLACADCADISDI
jgi:peroxiredoxin family protein